MMTSIFLSLIILFNSKKENVIYLLFEIINLGLNMEAIKEKGVSEWHRMSFRPCQTFSISEEDKKFCIIPKKNNNIDENKEETKKE